MFPTPKTVLHNFYQLCYGEQKMTARLSPTYRVVKTGKTSKWICTYHIFWPQEIKFHAKDDSKKEASYKAALAALNWLRNEGKIKENGDPVIYDKEEVKQLTKKNIPSINLSSNTLQKIQNLITLYENELFPNILEDKDKTMGGNNDLEESESLTKEMYVENNKRRSSISKNSYMSKEKVNLPIAKYK